MKKKTVFTASRKPEISIVPELFWGGGGTRFCSRSPIHLTAVEILHYTLHVQLDYTQNKFHISLIAKRDWSEVFVETVFESSFGFTYVLSGAVVELYLVNYANFWSYSSYR